MGREGSGCRVQGAGFASRFTVQGAGFVSRFTVQGAGCVSRFTVQGAGFACRFTVPGSWRILLVLLAVCAASAAPGATVIVPAEFREIVHGADVIAYGRVADLTVDESGGRGRVETLVTLHVGTYLKGGPGEILVFRVPGGQVGRYRTVMVGAPRFAPGDDVIVFLHAGASGHPTVFGLNQGVFRVRQDRQTRRRVVLPPPVFARSDGGERIVRGDGTRRPVPLETFGAQVQTVIAEGVPRSRQ